MRREIASVFAKIQLKIADKSIHVSSNSPQNAVTTDTESINQDTPPGAQNQQSAENTNSIKVDEEQKIHPEGRIQGCLLAASSCHC